jgi:hypothetical protein
LRDALAKSFGVPGVDGAVLSLSACLNEEVVAVAAAFLEVVVVAALSTQLAQNLWRRDAASEDEW